MCSKSGAAGIQNILCEYSISKDLPGNIWFGDILSAHYEYVVATYHNFTRTPLPVSQLTEALSLKTLSIVHHS